MRIQNFVFPNQVCEKKELYIRSNTEVEIIDNIIRLKSGQAVSSDTYMNALQLYEWCKYSVVDGIQLQMKVSGVGKLRVCHLYQGKSIVLHEQLIQCKQVESVVYALPISLKEGVVFWELEASESMAVVKSYYSTDLEPCNHINLGLNICTYKRNEQLQQNLEKLYSSKFFNIDSTYYGRLEIYITDNGDDFITNIHHPNIQLQQNSNRGGGTGGFTYGLDKITEQNECRSYDEKITHVIFMDDDVEFINESFYRVYAFLSYLAPGHQELSIAGRMFQMDERHMQYTAMEIWNQGEIMHVGGNTDVSILQNLEENKEKGEYGGWWFCVYPVTYTSQNRPFPFFLHCDDVEYGLRFGNEVITLKGVQVWHETYTYRQRPQITYYDIRNAAIVNAMYGCNKDKQQFIEAWGNQIGYFHDQKLTQYKFIAMMAIWHYLKGKEYICKHSQLPNRYTYMMRCPWLLNMISPILWRLVYYKLNHKFDEVIDSYKSTNKK